MACLILGHHHHPHVFILFILKNLFLLHTIFRFLPIIDNHIHILDRIQQHRRQTHPPLPRQLLLLAAIIINTVPKPTPPEIRRKPSRVEPGSPAEVMLAVPEDRRARTTRGTIPAGVEDGLEVGRWPATVDVDGVRDGAPSRTPSTSTVAGQRPTSSPSSTPAGMVPRVVRARRSSGTASITSAGLPGSTLLGFRRISGGVGLGTVLIMMAASRRSWRGRGGCVCLRCCWILSRMWI